MASRRKNAYARKMKSEHGMSMHKKKRKKKMPMDRKKFIEQAENALGDSEF